MRKISIAFFFLARLALAEDAKPSSPVVAAREFVQTYCFDCHNDKKQKGKTNLAPFLRDGTFERDVLLSVYDQLHLEEMPPDDEEQPPEEVRKQMLAFLSQTISASGATTLDKKSLPGYGNYVNHEALFEAELIDKQPAPPARRLWRYSPESFSERVNRVAGQDVIKFVPVATFPVPQSGLMHPAFPYKGPAHNLKDFSSIHDFGLTETELLIKLAEELAAAQLTSGSLRAYHSLPPGDAKWSSLLDEQFEKLYSRQPTDAERRLLLALQQKAATDSSVEIANEAMIAATYLRPETLFRFEVGPMAPAAGEAVNLAPLEYAYAVGLALNLTGPTPQMVKGLLEYNAKERKELKELIRPWIEDENAHQRILRFMAEYFQYGDAAFVFKDKDLFQYRPEWIIEDAEKFVSRIVKRDRNVVRELLTSSEYSVRGAFNYSNAAKWHQDQANGHRFYHSCYNVKKEDLRKDPEWHNFKGERAGILTHPAWLRPTSSEA